MITLKTITTIELSNDCQLACTYCVNRYMQKRAKRKRMIMNDEVFEASLSWLKVLCDNGTQQELNMNGTGESFLDPQLFSRIRRAREVMGLNRVISMSTNGIIMSDEIAKKIASSGLTDISVSIHRTEAARNAGQILATNHVRGSFNYGTVTSPHNWAGQLDPEHNARILPDIVCHPLIEGRGYISVEGNVSPCCYDYRFLGVFGTVFDKDLDQRPVAPFALCRTCHQQIPQAILDEYEVQQPKRKSFP